jgi:RNA 2',3'-cyclic 3'-phosphodiesterase
VVRLFVALNLPDGVRRALWAAAAPVRELGLPIKWVRPEGIHVTLKFLGEVPDAREPELRAALARAAAGGHALPLVVGGFGAFPGLERPRVIWAGLEPDPALEGLHHRVEQAFVPLGFPPEGRPFRPHVTLGRAARDARPRPCNGLEETLTGLRHQEATLVGAVDLMQSVLQSAGAVYHIRHSERLS